MTMKRFSVPVKYRFSHSKIQLNEEPLTNDELIRILNTNDGAFVENFSLKQENEQLKKELDKLEVVNEMLSMDFSNSEHELLKENEELKKQLNSFKPIIFEDANNKGCSILYEKELEE